MWHMAPVRMRADSGSWVDVDLTLQRQADGACRAAAQLRLAQIGADTVLVSLLNAYPGFRRVLGPSWDGKVSPAPGGGHDDRRIDLPPEAELELSRTTREVLWRDFGWRSAGGPATTPEWPPRFT